MLGFLLYTILACLVVIFILVLIFGDVEISKILRHFDICELKKQKDNLELENSTLRQSNKYLMQQNAQLQYLVRGDVVYGLGALSGDTDEVRRLRAHNKKLLERLSYFESKIN